MARAFRLVVLLAGGLSLACWTARLDAFGAEQTFEPRPNVSVVVGVREWISQGRSAHNIAAGGGSPNVLSELTWRGLNSPITEFSVDILADRLITKFAVGFGPIGGGTFRDQDWDGDHRTHKLFETLSAAEDGSVLYVAITPGFRLVHLHAPDNPIPGGLDLLLGYQFWRERYRAVGGEWIHPFSGPLNVGLALTQTNTWHSLRMGMAATIPFLPYFAVKGSVFYLPSSYYQNEDIHHLRTDLRQNPSFLSTASGGQGVQLEGALVARPWQRLLLEAGYRYWDIRSGSGVVEAYRADGFVVRQPFNVEHTRRHGVFFAINWVF